MVTHADNDAWLGEEQPEQVAEEMNGLGKIHG